MAPRISPVPSTSALLAATALADLPGRTIWEGSWHLIHPTVEGQSLQRLATDVFGGAEVIGHLRMQGMTGGASTSFNIAPSAHPKPGSGVGLVSVLFLGFRNGSQADNFSRSYGASGTSLSGVPGGSFLVITTRGGSCQGTCSVAVAVFSYRNLVVKVGAVCSVAMACGIIADPLARSLYSAMRRS